MNGVSIALAACNGASYLREQMDSIVQQLRAQDELIVSVDPSEDDTLAIARSYHDPRVQVVCGPGQGVLANFEHALSLCTRDVVFLSDQDDVWLPGKRDAMAACFDDPKVTAVVSDCRVVNAQLETEAPSFFEMHDSKPGFWNNFLRNSYIGCCMALRRSVLAEALPFPRTIPMHDQWLGLLASRKGRVVWLDQPLLLYRRHNHNASSLKPASLRQQIAWRLALAGALLNHSFHSKEKI